MSIGRSLLVGLAVASLGLAAPVLTSGPVAAKEEPHTATVKATWTVRVDHPQVIGSDANYEEWTYTLDGEAALANAYAQIFEGKGHLTIAYHAYFHSNDSTWHIGCETMEINTTGKVDKRKLPFTVEPTSSIVVAGTRRNYDGWMVYVPSLPPLRTTTTGSFQDWENMAMVNCVTTPITEPFNLWYVNPSVLISLAGKLNRDHAGVLLTKVQTNAKETFQMNGYINFSKPVRP